MRLNKEDGGNRKYILCTNNENNICKEVTYQRLKNIQKDLPHNLKYFKTDFISKMEDEDKTIREKMIEYIKPLIELEYHTEVNEKILIVFDEEQLEEILESKENVKIFLNSDILLSSNDREKAEKEKIEIVEIPEYYFKKELKEVGGI